MSDLWTEASYDAEADAKALNLETAKHASSGVWSYLALASSPEEYNDRVALAAESITTIAQTYDLPVEALTSTFDHRFALLMEAGSNPFADDSQDDDGDDSSESKDDDSDKPDDKDKDDDGDDDSDDNGDGHNDDSDDDEDSDDTGDGDDEDDSSGDGSDDSDKDDDGDSAPPWANKFATLAQRIQAGENPLEWSGNAPFVRSSARKHAADGADPVTDTNVPQDPAAGSQADTPSGNPMGDPTGVPGMDGGIAASTKPRQMPEGDGSGPGMGMDGITGEFDTDSNGGDIEQGADSALPGQPDEGTSDKIAAIAAEVRRYNPTLSHAQAARVAQRAYDTYLSKHAEDVNPLLYGDRAPVGDGPISGPLKNWSPADMKPPKLPGAPKPPGSGGGAPTAPPGAPAAAGEGAGAAGELAAGAGEAAELLPLLAL